MKRHSTNSILQGRHKKAAFETSALGVISDNKNNSGLAPTKREHISGTVILNTFSELKFPKVQHARKYLLFQNRTPSPMWINFSSPSDPKQGVEIPAGGSYERDTNAPTADIFMNGSYTGQTLNYVVL